MNAMINIIPPKRCPWIIKREMLLKVVVRPQTVLNSTLPHDLVKYLEKLQAEWWNGGILVAMSCLGVKPRTLIL